MAWAVHSLRRAKFWSSRRLSPRLYWNLMGKWRPVPAVTSACRSIEDSMESGRAVVDLLNALGVVAPDMVTLQIGCGLGRVESHLRAQVGKCWGVDVSPSMVKRARALVPYSNVEFVVSDGVSLSHWDDATFGLIYSFFVFQHLSRAQFDRYLCEAWAKLAPGGHLVFQLLVDDAESHPDPPSTHPFAIRYYRRHAVEEKLCATGFSVVGTTELSGDDVVFCATKA